MIPAFSQQWNQDLVSVWGVGDATLTFVPKSTAPAIGTWWVVFLDDTDQANALAYHDLTNEGLPISKVFVKTILSANESVSVGASHEVCEMAVDPWLNSAYQDPQGIFWAGEIADPVEDDRYGYDIGGVLVSDFVTPNWFAHPNPMPAIDLKGHVSMAFQVLTGGYAQKFDPQQGGWVQVTGALAAKSKRATAPIGSRRERRLRQWKNWTRSAVKWRRSPGQLAVAEGARTVPGAQDRLWSLVQLTRPDGSPVAINPDEIVQLSPVPTSGPEMGVLTHGTRIVFRNQSHQDVKESLDEVSAKVDAARRTGLTTLLSSIGAPITNTKALRAPKAAAAVAVNFATDIRPLFTDGDVACMAGTIDLRSYVDVKASAAQILGRLQNPDPAKVMPPSGSWPDAQISLFANWIKDGCQP